MKENILLKIEKLVNEKKIDEAQLQLSKLGQSYNNDANYLYLRGKVFYINKLYYAAIDALLIALEFEKNDKIYNLLAEIYGVLGNKDAGPAGDQGVTASVARRGRITRETCG